MAHMKARAQSARIIDWLATGRSLTPLQALRKFGCLRLSGRIYDLKQDGHSITKKMVTKGDSRVASYSLAH